MGGTSSLPFDVGLSMYRTPVPISVGVSHPKNVEQVGLGVKVT